MQYKEFLTLSLQEASKIANFYFGKVSGVTKEGDNNQVLTEADLEVGKLLVLKVQKAFSTHNIIDEEAGVIDNKSDYTWVIDPIDGTSNFANGVPLFGIMIGLLHKDVPITGGIALPFFNEVYFAEKGKGAFCNNQNIAVTAESDLLKVLIAYGIDGHQENPELTQNETKIFTEIVLHIRNLRSSNSAFDVAMVAKGGYGGMLNKTSKIWDNVAPQILIEEAKGIYSDFYGKQIDYSNPLQKANDNFTFCCASSTLHTKLQEIVNSTSVQD